MIIKNRLLSNFHEKSIHFIQYFFIIRYGKILQLFLLLPSFIPRQVVLPLPVFTLKRAEAYVCELKQIVHAILLM